MCAVGEGMACVVGGIAKITVTDRLTGGVEVVLRVLARPIASGEAEYRNSQDDQWELMVRHDVTVQSWRIYQPINNRSRNSIRPGKKAPRSTRGSPRGYKSHVLTAAALLSIAAHRGRVRKQRF